MSDPLADYLTLQQSVRSTYKQMDDAVNAIVKQELGWDLPRKILVKMGDTKYAISVYADAQKVSIEAPTRKLPEERRKVN